MATPLPSTSTLAAAPTSAVTALATTPSPAASVCTFGGDARRAPPASAADGALRGPAPMPMLTLPLPTYGAHLVANIGANGPLAVALGLCLLRRVDPGVLAAADATGTNKLLLAATTVAMKAHFDDFYVNKYMARIGGLETAKELGELEAHMFLTLLGGTATVRQKEIRATLDNGMIPIGKEVQKGGIDAEGAARKLAYLLEGDVAPLKPFPASLLAGPKVTPTTTPAGSKPAGRSPTTHIMPDAGAEAGLGPMPAFPSFHGAPSQLPSPHAMSDASPQANRSPHRWAGAQSGGAVSSTHASQLLGAEAGDAALFTPTVSSTAALLVPGHRDLCPSGDSSLRASPAAHAAGSGARLARSMTVTAAPAATGAGNDAAPALREESTRSP